MAWNQTTRHNFEQFQFRGRPLDFWGGYGWFQKKNILQTDFEGKKILQGTTLRKKNSYWLRKNIFQSGRCWKNVSQHYCMSGKIFLSPEFFGEKILTQTKSPIPLRTPSPIPSQKSNVRLGLGADGNQTLKCVSQMPFQWWKIGSEKLSTLLRADTLNNLPLRL